MKSFKHFLVSALIIFPLTLWAEEVFEEDFIEVPGITDVDVCIAEKLPARPVLIADDLSKDYKLADDETFLGDARSTPEVEDLRQEFNTCLKRFLEHRNHARLPYDRKTVVWGDVRLSIGRALEDLHIGKRGLEEILQQLQINLKHDLVNKSRARLLWAGKDPLEIYEPLITLTDHKRLERAYYLLKKLASFKDLEDSLVDQYDPRKLLTPALILKHYTLPLVERGAPPAYTQAFRLLESKVAAKDYAALKGSLEHLKKTFKTLAKISPTTRWHFGQVSMMVGAILSAHEVQNRI